MNKKITLVVSGMDCAGCAVSIERGVKALKGVVSVKVNYVLGKALIEFDPAIVKQQDLVKVIEKAGYKVVA